MLDDRPSTCRLLILPGADINTVDSENRATCVDPILSPLISIQDSVTVRGTYGAVLRIINASPVSPLKGFVSFAFEALKNSVDVCGDSEIKFFLQDHKRDRTKVENVASISHMLV